MRVLYFAWLRTEIGLGEERLRLPQKELSLAQLIDHLAQISPRHAEALSNRSSIKAAINHEYADWESVVRDEDEVAFFPPVTGG